MAKELRCGISHERLKELLHYNPETGDFTWRTNPKNTQRLGTVAGGWSLNGYRVVGVDNVQYKQHRLAWFYVYGVWPTQILDHIDRDRGNNRITNLRECHSPAESGENRGTPRNNTSGHIGVTCRKRCGVVSYEASISKSGIRYHLGLYRVLADAVAAYVQAKERLHTFNPAV